MCKGGIFQNCGCSGSSGCSCSFSNIELNLDVLHTYFSVRDTQYGSPIVITNTSEPATPDITYTIVSGDIPSDTTYVENYGIAITVGGAWTTEPDQYYVQMTLNGADNGSPGTNVTFGTDTGMWTIALCTSPINVGDIIGLKIYSDGNPMEVSISNQDIYVIPYSLKPIPNPVFPIQSSYFVIQGSISGVTYSTITDTYIQTQLGNSYDPPNSVIAITANFNCIVNNDPIHDTTLAPLKYTYSTLNILTLV